jgi:hypothetical protein
VVLPIHHGRETRRLLSDLPVELTYREYPIGHEISYDLPAGRHRLADRQLDRFNPTLVNEQQRSSGQSGSIRYRRRLNCKTLAEAR